LISIFLRKIRVFATGVRFEKHGGNFSWGRTRMRRFRSQGHVTNILFTEPPVAVGTPGAILVYMYNAPYLKEHSKKKELECLSY